MSFLNAEEPGPLEILTEMLSVVYHPTISAAQGQVAMDLVARAVESKDYYDPKKGLPAMEKQLEKKAELVGDAFMDEILKIARRPKMDFWDKA